MQYNYNDSEIELLDRILAILFNSSGGSTTYDILLSKLKLKSKLNHNDYFYAFPTYLKTLENDGYLNYKPNQKIILNPKGRSLIKQGGYKQKKEAWIKEQNQFKKDRELLQQLRELELEKLSITVKGIDKTIKEQSEFWTSTTEKNSIQIPFFFWKSFWILVSLIIAIASLGLHFYQYLYP